jgi:MOSC domain-containing protein YiiM
LRIISVNVGVPRTVNWNSRPVLTGIYKEPVSRRVKVRTLGLEGDAQADLTVHGGVGKAVYAYPVEHYGYWERQLGGIKLPWGMFGENLTTEGLLEEDAHLGDEFLVGSAKLIVTQPRFPCYKLGLKFGDMNMVKRFEDSERSGIYFAVKDEGEVGADDQIELIRRNMTLPTIASTFRSSP